MIREAHFKNFKVLRDVCIDLQPLTVIVGPNSSGKTTILQGLDCLSRCFSANEANNLRRTVFQGDLSPRLIHSREPQGQLELGCIGKLQDKDFAFSVTFDKDGPLPKAQLDRATLPGFSYPSHLKGSVSPAVLLRLDPRKLAAPSFQGVVEVLPSDGEGISSLLADLYLQRSDRLQDIVRQLRACRPRRSKYHHTALEKADESHRL